MRARWSARGWAVCLTAAVLILSGCSGDSEDRMQAQLDEQADQLAKLKDTNAKLESELDDANRRLKEAASQFEHTSAGTGSELAAPMPAADPYVDRTEYDILVDDRIPPDAAALLFKMIGTVNAKPAADDKVWAQFFADPANMDRAYFIKHVLAGPELAYSKFFYQGETTYKKPGKETRTLVVIAKLKTDGDHAYALSSTNHAGWKIVDVD